MKSFGDRLRRARKMKNYSQEDVSRFLGITRPAYTAYELGKREPDHSTLIAISNILDVSIDFLLKGKPETLLAFRDGEITEEEARKLLELLLKKAFGKKD